MTCSVENPVRVTRNVKRVTSGTNGLRDTLRLTRYATRSLFDRVEPSPLWLVVAAILPCLVWTASAHAGAGAAAEQVAYEEVKGRVVSVTTQAVSVEYATKDQASYEMLLPFTQNVRLSHLRSLSELKPGDTVTVKYARTYKENDQGEKVILSTVATNLALMRRAPTSALLRGAENVSRPSEASSTVNAPKREKPHPPRLISSGEKPLE